MQQGITPSQESMTGVATTNGAAAMRFSAEDSGNSLTEMAQLDLDAALQLLADRAVYITGSTGAAIALRRRGKNDMLCRASTGAAAPELGALLSTEIGLSGESVRTRRTLRCDDAERDARVNREVCREMGIASVVVMPVVNDDQVLGVFELFSGKVNAFGERDLSALQRLSEMVETAVKLAQAAESVLATAESGPAITAAEKLQVSEAKVEVAAQNPPTNASPVPQAPAVPTASASVPKKPLLWSAASTSSANAAKPSEVDQAADQSHIPPVLRNLRKCEACGFPVSAGRTLCVECEEKKWRGHLRRSTPLPTPSIPVGSRTPTAAPEANAAPESAPVMRLQAVAKSGAAVAAAPAPAMPRKFGAEVAIASEKPAPPEPKSIPVVTIVSPVPAAPSSKPVAAVTPASKSSAKAAMPELILSAASTPPQSWLAANRYIVGALLVVAGTVAAILLLH